ncbi:hybrid sensor histidine kinase/response regulator [Echinicola pacifica]|uniref:histidine kinase n=1 Tax=Echinicola pacifica TaxID=346377 RepID=A0A918PWE0_9BACT|nr:two-component regulator propeller domain-containing protein [Echinicola pacifica]GGZ25185.1 hybrid sensor histidine kinase/response regulator [Echinicola pacifica]
MLLGTTKWLLFPFLLLATILNARQLPKSSNTVKFKNISLEEGLSQTSVLCILQDADGFLWFGTRDGLNKYDGNQFKVYRYGHEESNSLSSSTVKSLFQDEQGTLWVGSQNGLNYYIPAQDAFQRIKPHVPEKLETNYNVAAITSGGEGSLWMGTNYGLVKYNTLLHQYEEVSGNKEVRELLSQAMIRSIFKTPSASLWIKTLRNIYYFDPKKDQLTEYEYPQGLAKEQNDNQLSTIYVDHAGEVWLGIKSGLAKLDSSSQTFRTVEIDGHQITSEVRSIKEDQQGDLWVGTYRGLYRINKEKDKLSFYTHDDKIPNSLSQNSVYCIDEDDKGDIWIGTYAGGINHYDRSYDLFRHISAGTNSTQLNYKVVSSIIQDQRGDLWIGTEGGGINHYDALSGEFRYYTHQSENPNSLINNNVKAMLRDHKGGFWVGTHEGGLDYFHPKQEPIQFQHYQYEPGQTEGLSDNRVISLLEDKQHQIWIGTSGGGLNVLDPASGKISRIESQDTPLNRIVFSIIQSSHPDTLLLGGDNGVMKINIHTKQTVPVNYAQTREGQENKWVLSLYEDPDNMLWVGTEGDGVYSYDPELKKSQQLGTRDGLPNAIIYGIVPDEAGNLWFSTNSGLSRMDRLTKQVKNFDESDGLQSNEFNYGAALKNEQGELLFGGANGLNIFDPRMIKENTFLPPIVITSLSVHNKHFLHITDSIQQIYLDHDQNVINIDFVALSYSQPEKNQYAYRLEGFDKEWNSIGNNHSATYTNLDAGEYIFRVKASNNDGLWNDEGAALPITIRSAPWRTWWAYTLYTLIIIFMVAQARRYWGIRNREKNELREERLAKERIEEVNRLKLQLFTNISHDFRTPLTLIIGPLQRMMHKAMGDTFVQQQHEVMYRNASVLMQLINELLDFRKNEAGQLKLRAGKYDLVEFTREVLLAFEEIARMKNITMDFSLYGDPEALWFDKVKLQKVLYNLLSNAFKFTPERGFITVSIRFPDASTKRKHQGKVIISLKNTGKGISKESLPYVFDRFYQQGDRMGSGIGLALSKSIIELHQGKIQAKSKVDEETVFQIQLPLGREHLSSDQLVVEQEEEDLMSFDQPVILETELLEEEETLEDLELESGKPSILVTEDNRELRQHICAVLREKYNVYEAGNGEAGLVAAMSHSVDLIISDIMMPKMDGIEFCQALKSNIRTSHIPVILLTAKTSENYQKSGFKTGADAYITKPFDMEILGLRIANLIDSRRRLIEKFKQELILQPKEVTASSADEEFLARAIEVMEEHMRNADFNAAGFVTEMGMSRSVVYRKLKDLTDQSISEFIRTIRLKRAAQLLQQTDMTISEIAFELGFNDLKYFRESFKSVYNCPPSSYRNQAPGS